MTAPEAGTFETAALVERCRRGDPLAWEALVRRHQARVFALAYHYMRDREEARDAAQDIFVRVYERLGLFRGTENFLPWMLSLARNLCLDRLRALKARKSDASVSIDVAPPLASDGTSPEAAAESVSRHRLLYRAIDKLSEKNREIILLKEIQGLKLEEISQMLAVPLGTIKSRSNRARIELAQRVRSLDPSYGG